MPGKVGRAAGWLIIGLIALGATIGVVWLVVRKPVSNPTGISAATTTQKPTEAPPLAVKTLPIVQAPQPLPAQVLLDVPYTVQAPLGVWDATHEEACEEASLLMVQKYLAKKPIPAADQVETELQQLIAWEAKHTYKVDLTVSQLSEVAGQYYQLTTGRVINQPTLEALKKELAAGHPIIVPAAGQQLPNPYFTPPGPIYHMLVIKGYDDQGFITNDPGTKRGQGFRYTYGSLLKAIHDWDPDTIQNGQPRVLVFD